MKGVKGFFQNGNITMRTGATMLVMSLAALGPTISYAEIDIGILAPLSGKGASYGQHQKVAVEMAQEKLAEEGGIKGEKVNFLFYDTRGENAEAISQTRRLIYNDEVLAVIGPYFSAETEVAFPLGVRGETPVITASSAKPGIAAKNRPWAFRNALASDQMNGHLVEAWLKANPDIKNVVILTDVKDAFTKIDGTAVFPAVLKERGIEILDNISFQTGDVDYAAQVTKTKQINPDGIVVAGLYNEGGNVVREIRKQGLTQPVIGALGMSEAKFLDIAGKSSEGVMVVMPFWTDNPDPRVAQWVAEYQKRSGGDKPGNTDALIYDTIFMLKTCIEKSGVTNKPDQLKEDRKKIRDCLDNMTDYPGIVGPITFNEDGDAILQPTVLKAEGGKWVTVK